MRHIFVIGGGELGDFETFDIDSEIVKATGKKNPIALFIPTASYDAVGYIEIFRKIYGDKLGCQIDVLFLYDENASSEIAKEKIGKADLIYVGGGNTKNLLSVWGKYKVDEYLKIAMEKGIILSGLDAGSICWFKAGLSDYEQTNLDIMDWSYKKLKGLNFIELLHVPHYNENSSEEEIGEFIYEGEVALAIDNNACVEIKGNTFRIHKANPYARVQQVYWKDGKLEKVTLENMEFRLLGELLII